MAKNIFNTVKMTKPGKNVFDLSHDVKLSCNMGQLIPILTQECVPGDKFNISCESLIRFAPMVAPVMHRMDVSMHYFFVPHRLSWANWEKWITGNQGNPGTIAFPYISMNSAGKYDLANYLGMPQANPGATELTNVSALPFAAYTRIWNEYFRDQNLQAEANADLLNGSNNSNYDIQTLRKRAWEHDYFTAALPFAQKGPAVDVPLGDVVLKQWDPSVQGYPHFERPSGEFEVGPVEQISSGPSDPRIDINGLGDHAYDPSGTLEVGPTTINDLRRAFRLQEWLEKNARAGSRYVESILAHFGVRSSDKRLQRPEYITGIKSPVVVSEVLNTTGTEDAPQGQMAGHGVSVSGGKYGSYFCEEHGYIIGVMSVMPKTAYMQGIPKHFLKIDDPYQYFWPEFANIGEQPVENRELYAYTPEGKETFGYVPRYAEYKYMPSRVAGDFADNLDFWHLARKFAAPPALNQDFVQADPTHRIFAVTDPAEQKLWCHVYNKIRAVRPMPKYGTPTF